jgi:hypothetical protein
MKGWISAVEIKHNNSIYIVDYKNKITWVVVGFLVLP